MENLPAYISILFVLTTFFAAFLFFKAASYNRTVIIASIVWLAIQAIVASTGFYTVTNSIPPRFVIAVLPPLVLIVFLFTSRNGKQFIDKMDQRTLTLLHVIRMPVEIVLLWLSIYKLVPSIMTFEGRNFDIVSGISAPLVYYFAFVQKRMSRTALLAWNYICLALLLNIVITAILAAPFPFQKLAFDQPNIAIFYFPFIWLPGFVVPLVLFAHLVVIRRLWREKKLLAISF
jgi:hypothetical protein